MPTRYAGVKSTPQPVSVQTDPSMIRAAGGTGGYAFKLTPMEQLKRFLIMGVESGTVYLGREEVAYKNVAAVDAALASDGVKAIDLAVEVSKEGRALKNGPALYVVAAGCASKDPTVRQAAFAAIPQVCRTGTHILNFCAEVQELRGWGSGLKRAVGRWFDRPSDKLAYQIAKYKQRDGFSMGDLLRLTHPVPSSAAHEAVFRYITSGPGGMAERLVKGSEKAGRKDRKYPAANAKVLPSILGAMDEALHLDCSKGGDRRRMAALISEHGLSHEMLPSEAKNHAEIWEALLPSIGSEALLRNLNKLAQLGMTPPLGAVTAEICRRFEDGDVLRKDRLHPMRILVGMRQYATGHGDQGGLSWTPSEQIVRALDGAFYLAFKQAEPTGKRFMLGLDISGSMSNPIQTPGKGGRAGRELPISFREAAACMAMVVARSEKRWAAYGFSRDLVALQGFGSSRIDQMDSYLDQWSHNFGPTNPGALFEHAMNGRMEVDCFVVLTDNDVNSGRHCHQLLRQYRDKVGVAAKCMVVAMAPVEVSIADPTDPGMLDTSGFDAGLPEILRTFAAS